MHSVNLVLNNLFKVKETVLILGNVHNKDPWLGYITYISLNIIQGGKKKVYESI